MRVAVTECTIEAVVEVTEAATVELSAAAGDLGGVSPRRSSTETEADKVRRQQHLRRKTKLARHALTANRSR